MGLPVSFREIVFRLGFPIQKADMFPDPGTEEKHLKTFLYHHTRIKIIRDRGGQNDDKEVEG
jgi:hypothetical protein